MNLFTVIPVEHDATSFYRALQPICQLRKIMPDLHIYPHPKEVTLSALAHMDVVFLQRPNSVEHLQVMEMCRLLRIPVWVEYDDNLLCVPQSNPAFMYSEQTKENVKKILNLADVISVSTRKLANDLAKEVKVDKKIYVIPNALNDYLFQEKPVFKPHNVVMWRGTQSHQQDMMTFAPNILEVSKKHPQWLFNFMGYNPFFLTGPMGAQAKHTDGMEIIKYHECLKLINPNVCMVALSDSDFNRCKSNIAWIEATYAGAVTVAPFMDEWQMPGVVNYSPGRFEHALDQVLSMTEREKEICHATSWEYIRHNLLLSKVNKLRKALLEDLGQ